MSKQFLAVVVVVIALLVGVFALTSNNKNGQNGVPAASQPTNHVLGAGKKGVTLIEYGDFQCPTCKQFFPILNEVKKEYGDDITFQFRHFPLTQIHPNAMAAHRAAEAAGKQGKFFEMHDLLYQEQDTWSSLPDPTSVFEGYATQIGLNIDQYKSDVASEAVAAAINADTKAGNEAGVSGTPTFILNGQKIKNPQSFDEFKKVIDEAIKNAGQTP